MHDALEQIPLTNAGQSLLELFWSRLDLAVNEFMTIDSDYNRGYASGICTLIAILTDAYNPNPEAIKKIALDRWETNHE